MPTPRMRMPSRKIPSHKIPSQSNSTHHDFAQCGRTQPQPRADGCRVELHGALFRRNSRASLTMTLAPRNGFNSHLGLTSLKTRSIQRLTGNEQQTSLLILGHHVCRLGSSHRRNCIPKPEGGTREAKRWRGRNRTNRRPSLRVKTARHPHGFVHKPASRTGWLTNSHETKNASLAQMCRLQKVPHPGIAKHLFSNPTKQDSKRILVFYTCTLSAYVTRDAAKRRRRRPTQHETPKGRDRRGRPQTRDK